MEATLLPVITQLGVAAFSIYIMYLMFVTSDKRFKEKDAALLNEVDEHKQTLREHQTYLREIHSSTLTQLSSASKVIQDNVKAYERVIAVLDKK